MAHVLRAFLTVFFGYAACIIGSFAVFMKRLDPVSSLEVLSASLAFTGGMMLYVGLVHLYPGALVQFIFDGNSIGLSHVYTWLSFASGFLVVYIIEMVLRYAHDTTARRDLEIQIIRNDLEQTEETLSTSRNTSFGIMDSPRKKEATKTWRIRRMGVIIAITIGMHNFPEGLVTYAVVSRNPANTIVFGFSLFLHDLFEGILVVLPFYFATGSRRKAFWLALATATLEPLGAFASWIFVPNGLTGSTFGVIFGLIGGMEVCLTLKELLPTARQGDLQDQYVSFFSLLGMLTISLGYSLLSFGIDEKSLDHAH